MRCQMRIERHDFEEKNLFRLIFFYEAVRQKSKSFNAGKIRKYVDEGMFFREKKCFHLFKSLLNKNGRAQILLVVAGCLV